MTESELQEILTFLADDIESDLGDKHLARLVAELRRLRVMEDRLRQVFGPAIPPAASIDWMTFYDRLIKPAVAEEREACARVADAHNLPVDSAHPSYYDQCGRRECAENIASEIRGRCQPPSHP